MTYELPEHARLYADVMRVLPAPGEVLTWETHHVITELLHEDLDVRRKKTEIKPAPAEPEKPAEPERPTLTAGSHLADSSKSFGFTYRRPETHVIPGGRA